MLVLNADTGVSKVQDGVVDLSTDVTGTLPLNSAVVGSVLQVANYTTGAVATGTALIPWDSTVPQITEGTQFMSLAFTPKKANSLIIVECNVQLLYSSGSSGAVCSIFKDVIASAVCSQGSNSISGIIISHNIKHIETLSTSSPITFSVRAGCASAGTTYFNQSGSGVTLGNTMKSSITITEIAQ